MADKYEVLYSRVTFAGSPCEKGIVISTPENGWIWLKDRRKETIEKGQVPASEDQADEEWPDNIFGALQGTPRAHH